MIFTTVHWIDIGSSEFDTMIRKILSWSGQEDESKRKEDKRCFKCVWKFEHNAEEFDFKNRVRTCTHEAILIKSSCTFGDLEKEVSLTTDIFMRKQMPIYPGCVSEKIVEQVDVHVLELAELIIDATGEVIQPIRVPDCVVEQTVDIPSPKIQEHIVEVMKVIRFLEERRRRIFEKYTKVQKLRGPRRPKNVDLRRRKNCNVSMPRKRDGVKRRRQENDKRRKRISVRLKRRSVWSRSTQHRRSWTLGGWNRASRTLSG